MGIRETLNEKKSITTGATIALVLIALIFIIYQVKGGGSAGGRVQNPTAAYFTVDDGATYFSDDITNVPPFNYNGKQAVRAYVFKCPSGAAFVGYLERFTPKLRQQIDASRALGAIGHYSLDQMLSPGHQVKAPLTGDKGWVSMNSPGGGKLVVPKCPGGSDDVPDAVVP